MSAIVPESRPAEATTVVETPGRERKRVIIIGGGFAGIAAAHALRHADAEVVLIDRRNHRCSIRWPRRSSLLPRSPRRSVSSRRNGETSAYS